MNIRTEQFNDVHLHARSLQGWGAIYNQISPGQARSVLEQFSTPCAHAFRECIDKRVVQHGEAPRGHICFAIPVAIQGTARVQGREADANCLFVLQGGDEYIFHMPMSMDMLSITFEREAFERAMTGAPWPAGIDALLRQPIIRVPGHRLAHCREQLLRLFQAVMACPEAVDAPEAEQGIEHAMLGELTRLIADPACDRTQRSTCSSHGFIVEKCHRMTMLDSAQAPSIEQLSRRLKVNRRTLQNSFRSVAETNPVSYLRSLRLNGVRRELTQTTLGELSIGDAAANWGFFQLSHFASKYQDLFGELPSQTRRARCPSGVSRAACA